jgi:hypothetical protein
MSATRELVKAHTVAIDFIGTDIENPPSHRNRYGIKCTCGDLDESASLDMLSADRRISQHLADVGLAQDSISLY